MPLKIKFYMKDGQKIKESASSMLRTFQAYFSESVKNILAVSFACDLKIEE